MRYPLATLALAALASHAFAQEQQYTAKSLFFGQDNSVVAVGTEQPSATAATSATAVAAAPGEGKPAGKIVKVAQKKPAQIGVSYFIRLKDADGTTHDVLARRVFKSGEHFQLGVKVNRPSYVYILNEAPDGTVTQIYPQPAQDNFVDAMGTVFFPARGSFVFDDKPGMEKLMVFLTPEREHQDVTQRLRHVAPDLVSTPAAMNTAAATCTTPGLATADAASGDVMPAMAASGGVAPMQTADASNGAAPMQMPMPDTQANPAPMQMADASTGYAAKGIAFSPEQGPASGCGNTQTQDYSAKGIAFSDDAAPAAGGQVASYVVKQAPKSGGHLYLKINLAHE
ncbi:uncharacterized protein DUF4384 [Paraburkholderia caballeronis]|nr:uncharacterized protein DUF4384 [Paraburkholderia caballeronis]